MDTRAGTIEFKHRGTFLDAIRAYKKRKDEWQAKIDIKLSQMEEKKSKSNK